MALSMMWSKANTSNPINELKAATLIDFTDKHGNKFLQTLGFKDRCNIKITRTSPVKGIRIIHIPLSEMVASRTRIVVTDYDADIYWKAGQYSLEVKTENVKKAIKTTDQQRLLFNSDYAYIYISPASKEHANAIKNILITLINGCS
jgi:hypothetical protein